MTAASMSLISYSPTGLDTPKRARVEAGENRFKRFSKALFNYVHTFLDPRELAELLPTCKRLYKSAGDIYLMSSREVRSVEDVLGWLKFSNESLRVPRNYTQVVDLMKNLRFLKLNGKGLFSARAQREQVRQILASKVVSQLTELHVSSGLSNATAYDIATRCSELNTLHLNWCFDLTDEGTTRLTRLTKLHTASFYGSPRVSTKTAERLAKMPSLTGVNLMGCLGMTHEAVSALLDAPSLRSLELGGINGDHDYQEQQRIAGVIAEKGGNLTHLVTLHTQYEPARFIQIASGCQQLIQLDMRAFDLPTASQRASLRSAMEEQNPRLTILGLCPPADAESDSDEF
ncbi:MAG: hypothetical protein HYX48_06060 [Chlamydiales bacterium]|nr:hypothetical protein [Chlamydiales bacterium]